MGIYKIIFKFGKTTHVAKREGKTGQDALNDIKEQCRIANKAYKKKKSFEVLEITPIIHPLVCSKTIVHDITITPTGTEF